MNMKSIDTRIMTAISSIALAVAVTGCDKDNEADSDAGNAPEVTKDGAVVSAPVKLAPAPEQPAAEQAPAAEVKELSKVVVTVNGKKLMRTELDKEMEMFTSSPQFASMQPAQAEMIRKQIETRIVDRFVNQTVLTAEADKEDIKVTDEEIEKAIKEIKERVPPNVTLEDALKERGMSMEEFRKNIATDLRIRTLIENQTASISNATDEAVSAFYNENKAKFNQPETTHARHILVKVEKDADEATKAAKKAEIEGYRKQLVDGTAKFEDLAGEHSDCPSGKRGGDLGTFGRGQMVPEFDTAAFEQEINAIGPVIETQFGYHIVQVIERTAAGERSLEDVKDEIAEQLTNKSKQEFVEKYIKELSDKAEITHGDK